MNPEMMKAAADAMQQMKPEDLAQITKLAASQNDDAATKVEKIQKATEVLSGLSTESVMGVSKQMGYEMTEGQAKMMTTFVAFVSKVLKMLIALKNLIISKAF